jgi:uncharacterized protein YchJ
VNECKPLQDGFNELPEEKHSELSTFRKADDGRWLFLDGVTYVE